MSLPGVRLEPPAMPGVTVQAPAALPGVDSLSLALAAVAGEFQLGMPAMPRITSPDLARLDVETLIREAFRWGNRMICITKDNRGKFQTSMKRPDGTSFAVEVHDDVIASLRGALNPLTL